MVNVIIPKVNVSDSGVYTCSAANSENQIPASKSITITVANGKSSKVIQLNSDNREPV